MIPKRPIAMRRRRVIAAATAAFALFLPAALLAQDGVDWITKFPRAGIHVAAWPGGKKVAVSFALFVEKFGFGQGPVYRPDLASRTGFVDFTTGRESIVTAPGPGRPK